MKQAFLTFTLAVAACLALAVRPAAGQTDYFTAEFYTRGPDVADYLDQETDEGKVFYVPVSTWAVLPRITLTATRDDNLFLNAQHRRAGTVVNVIPGIMAVYGRAGHNRLYADYGSIIPVYDSTHDLQKKPSHLLTLGGDYSTGKSKVYGRLGYRHSEDADTLVGARIVRTDYIGDAGVEHRLSGKTSAGLVGNAEFHEYDNPSYFDYRRLYAAGRLFRRATAHSDAFLQLGAGQDTLDASGSYGDANFYDASVGLRGRPTPKTDASGRIGYMKREYVDSSLNDVEHWIAALYGDVKPFGLSTFWAELYSDIRPAVNAEGFSTVDERLTAGVARRLLSNRVKGHASAFVGQVAYHGPGGQPANPADEPGFVFDGRKDDYWGYSLGVDWWSRKNMSAGLDYSYTENRGAQDSNAKLQDETSFDSGRWTLRVSWNY